MEIDIIKTLIVLEKLGTTSTVKPMVEQREVKPVYSGIP